MYQTVDSKKQQDWLEFITKEQMLLSSLAFAILLYLKQNNVWIPLPYIFIPVIVFLVAATIYLFKQYQVLRSSHPPLYTVLVVHLFLAFIAINLQLYFALTHLSSDPSTYNLVNQLKFYSPAYFIVITCICWYLWFLPGLNDPSVTGLSYTTPMTIGTYIIASLITLLYLTFNGPFINSAYLAYPLTFASCIHILNKLQDTHDDFLFTLDKKCSIKLNSEMFLACMVFLIALTYSIFEQTHLVSYSRLCLFLLIWLFLQAKLISQNISLFKH